MKKEWIQMTPLNHLEEVFLSPPPSPPPSSSSLKQHFIMIYTLEQSEEYESPFEEDEKVLQSKYDQGCKFSLPLRKNPM